MFSVLIVDDNEDDRYLLKRQLEEVGLASNVFEEDDGKTGIEFLERYEENRKSCPGQFPPILIFVDINMPLIGGLEFLDLFAALRKKKDFHSSILMMFTSSEKEQDKKRAFAHEFVKGYIVKMPPTSEDLKKALMKACPELF